MAATDTLDPPAVFVPAPPPEAPVRKINSAELKLLAGSLTTLFEKYSRDRNQAELKWLRNLRQYLGVYDPEIEQTLGKGRSRAYPRVTRVKCISMLSRVMNLMFPGVEKNWSLKASPSADMSPEDVQQAIKRTMDRLGASGQQVEMTDELVQTAVNELAADRAKNLEIWIDDQLQELGGDQTLDYVSLNRQVLKSGILYGLGVLYGPFVRSDSYTKWGVGEDGKPSATNATKFKPQYEFLPIWDFYGDMSAKTFFQMDGYFIRKVMSKSQVRELAERKDFFEKVIKSYLKNNAVGNYKPKTYETLLRNMGVRETVAQDPAGIDPGGKYEIIVWHGPISGQYLQAAGVEVAEDKLAEDMNAEVWMIDGQVIKCDINGWAKLGLDVRMIHPFVFDEDDTSPAGNGLPNVMRDSQMAVCAATRMLLDNASIVTGPNLEVNTALMRPDQDITSIESHKIWYRDDEGQSAQYPAVRNVQIDAHMQELMGAIDLFQRFADSETFVGPATGGDMDRNKSSEPMRSAVGASMLRSDAALPFKDIVRNFDIFTMSVIYSIVQFNKLFNPGAAPAGDYNVIARGATAMIAKELRGMQMDQLAQTLTDEEKMEIDMRKFARARIEIRDMGDLLVSETQATVNRQNREQSQAEMMAQQKEIAQAQIREMLSSAFKNIAQGNKNAANADAQTVQVVLDLLERGLEDAAQGQGQGGGDTGGSQAKAGQ